MSKTLYILDSDGELVRSLASLLSSPDLVVEIRSSGEQLLANFDAEGAACVLVEIHLPGMGAVEIARQLHLRGVAIPVIPMDARAVANRSTELGGRALSSELLGGSNLGGLALGATVETIETLRARFQRLTPREREVAGLVAQGHSSRELAQALNLSKSTVDNHRARILEKLQLANSVQLTRSLSMLLAEPE